MVGRDFNNGCRKTGGELKLVALKPCKRGLETGTQLVPARLRVYFAAPARTAVYFQLLDHKGRCVQTMRSWTMVQASEPAACVGCHEDKQDCPVV